MRVKKLMPVYNKTCVRGTARRVVIRPAINTLGRKIRESGKSTRSSQARVQDFAVSKSASASSQRPHDALQLLSSSPTCFIRSITSIRRKKNSLIMYFATECPFKSCSKHILSFGIFLFKKFYIKIMF